MAIWKRGDKENFALAIDMFVTWCRASGIEAFVALANTVEAWRAEILNYAASGGASNGFAEALNHLLKNQKRQEHGYRTWEGFRGQMLWAFGEAVDPDTAKLCLYDLFREAKEPGGFNLNSRRAAKRPTEVSGEPLFWRSSSSGSTVEKNSASCSSATSTTRGYIARVILTWAPTVKQQPSLFVKQERRRSYKPLHSRSGHTVDRH